MVKKRQVVCEIAWAHAMQDFYHERQNSMLLCIQLEVVEQDIYRRAFIASGGLQVLETMQEIRAVVLNPLQLCR